MPTAYEQTYGEVTFYDLTGTKLYAMTADLGLWLVEDTEPSPDPKWVRVDVPGADGAVDLSRALAGQVTYEMRDITLRFGGNRADHATALALVRTLRSALHGARVRVKTMLTGLVNGYYIADCECDGIAHSGGEVEIEVRAWADPFIRVGTQTLALPGTTTHSTSAALRVASPAADLLAGAGSMTAAYATGWTADGGAVGATTAHLWWATGSNLFDPSMWIVRGWRSSDSWVSNHEPWPVTLDGQVIRLGDVDATHQYRVDVIATARRGVTASPAMPFVSATQPYGQSYSAAVFMSGSVSAVSSPSVLLTEKHYIFIEQDGYISGGTATSNASTMSISAGNTYDVDRVAYGTVNPSYPSNRPASALTLDVSGVTATGLELAIGITHGSTALSTFELAELAYATVDFGGTFYGTSGSGAKTDVAVINPYGEVVTTHVYDRVPGSNRYVEVTSYETRGSIDGWPPEDATVLCISPINLYGEECAEYVLSCEWAEIATVTGSNSTMRSTPTITSVGGAYVSIDGRDAIVGAGTQELRGLTIPGGSFSVDYATLDGANATMTWEGGVL